MGLDELNVEELLEAIKNNMFVTDNINDVMQSKMFELEEIQKNFDVTWDNFNIVSNSRKYELQLLRQFRVSTILLRLLSTIINNQFAVSELSNIDDEIKEAIVYLKEEKQLLDLIQVALIKLQNIGAYECNYNISLLLSYIVEKNSMMIDRINKNVNISNARIKGISITKGTKSEEDEKVLDAKIEETVLKLGLKKQE